MAACAFLKNVFISASHLDDREYVETLSRNVFYELEVLNYFATVLSTIRTPSIHTLQTLLLYNHVWLRAIEGHCKGRTSWFVGKAKHGGQLLDEYERTEREFRFTALLIVPDQNTLDYFL